MTRDAARSMRVERAAVQLTVYLAEPQVGDRRSRVDQLLREAARRGGLGATVLAGDAGFGRHHSHQPSGWHRADARPLTIIFVDIAERIEAVLDLIDEFLPGAVVVSERVRSIRYIRPHQHPPG